VVGFLHAGSADRFAREAAAFRQGLGAVEGLYSFHVLNEHAKPQSPLWPVWPVWPDEFESEQEMQHGRAR
jgi:hypothetical protein